MSNNVSTFFQTLVAAATEASAALVGQTQLVDAVYQDYKPVTLSPFNTMQIPLPDQSTLSDIGAGNFTPVDVSAGMATLTFQNHPGIAYVIRDFEQYRSPETIRTLFLDATFKRAIEYLNGQISALITRSQFSTYAPIVTSAGTANLGINDYAKAWGALAAGKIPVQETDNMRLAVHPDVYANLLTNSNWVAESMVGRLMSDSVRRDAWLGQQFGAHVVWDQQMQKGANVVATQSLASGGTVSITSGSTALTGTGTTFTTDLIPGAYYTINGYAGNPVQVVSVQSNTSATLAVAASATVASANMTEAYKALYFHKYAIALGLRNLPAPDERVVDYTTVFVKGVPMRVMIGYNQLMAGYVVTVDFGFALGVVRPNFGQIILM